MPPYLIIQLAVLAAVAAIVLYWRFEASARFERHRLAEDQTLRAMRGMQATTLTLKSELEELRETCRDLASRPSGPGTTGMLPAKRNQALKMLRKGEAPETVSAALGIPRSHVQLLLKVRSMTEARAGTQLPATLT